MSIPTETIWHSFHQPLLRFVRRRVADEAAAEDVLQDVFLKVHLQIGTLQDAAKLESWLYQLTRNAIVDYYRRVRPTAALPETLSGATGAVEREAEQSLLPAVRSMIDELPLIYREALLLVEYEGISQKALAEQLGISISGAKSRVQRARQQLKQRLLDCCHFELDRRNAIISYQPRCACCTHGDCAPECAGARG